MIFKYKAVDQNGAIIEDEHEAENISELLRYLHSKNWKPLSVNRGNSAQKIAAKNIFGGTINLVDQIFLSKYLGLMLKIGTGLIQAVLILLEDFEKPAVKNFLNEVKSNLEKGLPFHTTFKKYPKVFSEFYTSLIKAGESSGSLEKVFDNLARTLSREKELRDQIKGALIYPIILLVGATAMLYFLISYAIPKIADVFNKSGFEPPGFSKLVFSLGDFFSENGLLILGAIFFLIIAISLLNKFSITFKHLLSEIIRRIPVARELIKKIALQRFASTLSSLMRAGLPITEALEITAETVSHIELKDALYRISREGLAKGLTVGESFKREKTFPRTVVNLIAISEKAGHMEEVLDTLAEFYTGEIEGSLKSLVSFLEPVMLFGIGIVIGIIALSIVLPIYQLTTSI